MHENQLELYNNGQMLHFNDTQDEQLFDGSNYHAPGVMYSLYPNFAMLNKAECYVNAAERFQSEIKENPTGPYEARSVEHTEGCVYIRECSTKVVLNTPTDLFNHFVLECDKQHSFSTPLDSGTGAFNDDYVKTLGVNEQHPDL